jgi:hypothetical protein
VNERIKVLIEQATTRIDPIAHDGACWDFDKEKFAQLIVRECVEQIITKGTDWIDFAPSQTGVRPEYWNMAQQIKQHFGVEE